MPGPGSKEKATLRDPAEGSAPTSGPLLEGEPSSVGGEGRRKRGSELPLAWAGHLGPIGDTPKRISIPRF